MSLPDLNPQFEAHTARRQVVLSMPSSVMTRRFMSSCQVERETAAGGSPHPSSSLRGRAEPGSVCSSSESRSGPAPTGLGKSPCLHWPLNSQGKQHIKGWESTDETSGFTGIQLFEGQSRALLHKDSSQSFMSLWAIRPQPAGIPEVLPRARQR